MQENNSLNMEVDMEDQRQLPDCSMATDDDGDVDGDGDEYVVANRTKANALMSGSIQSVTGASVTAGDDPTLNGEDVPTPHARPDPPDDVLDDVNMITPAPPAASLDSDRVELCEEGCSLSMPVDGEYDGHNDSDRDSNSELQPLRRHPSIVTSTPQSDLTKRVLSEDTFSFLIYSHVLSRAFFLATFVFTFQIAIYSVLAYDITNISNQRNPLKLPVGVETPVRIASAFAIVVAIITQDDARKVVNLLRDGFDQDLANAFQGTTKTKWILSIVLRGSEGLMGLFLTVLLIMQSTTVLDLLLNFLAMEFVSLLDDVVFVLTKEGFFGGVLQKEAKKISNTFYHASHLSTDSRVASFVTKSYFIFLFTIMFGAWGIISVNQVSGEYLCNQLFAQFSEEALPMIGTFTGLFYLVNKQIIGGRVSYRDDQVGGPLLAYCEDETRWTLSLMKDANPCNWLAASSESASFDVLTTTSSPWVYKAPSNLEVPLTHHFLMCYECTHADNFCGDYGSCVPAGKYSYDACICNKDRYGLRCEYSKPCQIIEAEGSAKEGGGLFASKYYRLEGAETYYRPVYTSLGGNESLSDDTDFIFFTGERWIMSYKHLLPGLKHVSDTWGLVKYFSYFHGYFTCYSAEYESEPVYIDELGIYDTASPLGTRWRLSSSISKCSDQLRDNYLQNEYFIETELSCAECSTGNPCLGAVCHSNGTCGECPDGYSGSRCEIPPKSLSDGLCDAQYNNNKFGFDGGDCCDNTCRSTPENTCGKVEQGYIDTGYPWPPCAYNLWDLSAEQVNGVSSASRSGHAVALNGNGKVLAVADPGLSIVRLFDKDGAEWKQRGQHIQGKSDSNFGAVIGLSDESFNVVSNPRTSSMITLGVGAPRAGLVRVFTCSTDGCIQKGGDIFGGLGFGSSLSMSKEGDIIAIGGNARETVAQRIATNGEVKVFTWSNDTWGERGTVPIAPPLLRRLSDSSDHFRLEGYYVSLSGDHLAVGTLEGKVSPGPRFESAKLITQVFKWNNSRWEKLGDEIEKIFYHDASFGAPWPLKSITIKGSILAVGSISTVDVYSWNEPSKVWIPREVELAKGPKGFVGWSVDLSEDASILAIGTNVDNPLPTDESIRMYKWNGTHYKALFNGVPGGTAASLSLSRDGKAIAVGLPYDSSSGGSTRVYNFYSESPCDDTSKIPVRISFTTDGSPQETSWELLVDSEVKFRSGSLAGHMYTTFVEEICVPAEACVRFNVYDTKGDGLNPPGVYALMLNGVFVAGGSDFGAFESYSMANCAPTSSPSPTQGPPQAPPTTPPPSSLTKFPVTQPPSVSP